MKSSENVNKKKNKVKKLLTELDILESETKPLSPPPKPFTPSKLRKTFTDVQKELNEENIKKLRDKELLKDDVIEKLQRTNLNLLKINFFNPFSVFSIYKHYLNKKDVILVQMQQKNGYKDLFYIYPTNNRFLYRSGSYILDDSKKEYIPSLNVFMLTYHEGCSIPYTSSIDITKVQQKFKEEEVNVRTALNPLSLSEYLTSDVIRTAVSGTDAFNKIIWTIILGGVNLLFIFIVLLVVFFR